MKAEGFYFHMAVFILEYTFSPNTPDIGAALATFLQ